MKRSSLFRILLSIVFNRPKTLASALTIQPATHPQHPLLADSDTWKAHWKAQGQPWRTEPEIDAERQNFLAKRRSIKPDWKQGIYPFKGIRLSRADVEWLLATHENGRGPIDWSDESLYEREGLDLRGADLQFLDLSKLPLTRVRGGLSWDEWSQATKEQRNAAAIHLEGCNFVKAHLEDASLIESHLEDARLVEVHLERADLYGTHLRNADLKGAFLSSVDLYNAHLANEKRIGPHLADAHWGEANLAVVKWSQMKMIGDEYVARQKKRDGMEKDQSILLEGYEGAVRAYRQLAVALQAQGLNEDAARFAYRAQVLQRKVLWREHKFWKWLGSAILALLAGYGYRMWRIIAAYLIIVSACAVAYFILGIYFSPHISPSQAFLESIMAFHGRVFFELFNPGEPQIWVTAFEAIAGLVIEGVFIAMLAQRFFGK